MRFLAPLAGFTDPRFGILTSYKHGIAAGVSAGLQWAADLGALSGPEYVKRYNPEESLPWLERMSPYRSTCLFVTVPDHVGDAKRTLEEFSRISFPNWPLALVAQDGLEDLDFPPADTWAALFIGGSNEWKMSDSALDCITRAQEIGKHVHIGRVNRFRRYKHFRSLEGSEGFTCDGTYTRYAKDEALENWARYMEAPRQLGLYIPRRDRNGESPTR